MSSQTSLESSLLLNHFGCRLYKNKQAPKIIKRKFSDLIDNWIKQHNISKQLTDQLKKNDAICELESMFVHSNLLTLSTNELSGEGSHILTINVEYHLRQCEILLKKQHSLKLNSLKALSKPFKGLTEKSIFSIQVSITQARFVLTNKKLQSELINLSSINDLLSKIRAKQRRQNIVFQNQLQKYKHNLQQKKKKIENTLEATNKDIKALTAQLTNKKAIPDYDRDVKLAQKRQKLQSERDVLIKELEYIENNLSLSIQEPQFNAELQNQQQKLDSIISKIKLLETKMTELSKLWLDILNDIDSLSSNPSLISSDLPSIQQKISSINSELQQLTTELNDASKECTAYTTNNSLNLQEKFKILSI